MRIQKKKKKKKNNQSIWHQKTAFEKELAFQAD